METLRIESRDRSNNFISTLVITYEYHYNGKKVAEDGYSYHEERATLVSAEMELSSCGWVVVPVELTDELKAHYELLITQHTGLEIEQGVAA